MRNGDLSTEPNVPLLRDLVYSSLQFFDSLGILAESAGLDDRPWNLFSPAGFQEFWHRRGRGKDDRDIDLPMNVVEGGVDSSSVENAFPVTHQQNLPSELEFEKVLDDVSGEVIRVF